MDAISGLSESLFSKSKQTRQQAGIFLTFITLVVVRVLTGSKKKKAQDSVASARPYGVGIPPSKIAYSPWHPGLYPWLHQKEAFTRTGYILPGHSICRLSFIVHCLCLSPHPERRYYLPVLLASLLKHFAQFPTTLQNSQLFIVCFCAFFFLGLSFRIPSPVN